MLQPGTEQTLTAGFTVPGPGTYRAALSARSVNGAAARLANDTGYSTRLTVRELRFNPAVSPKKNLKHLWEYDWELYKRRNETERFFRRLKGFRGIFTCYDKLDRMLRRLFVPLALCEQAPRGRGAPFDKEHMSHSVSRAEPSKVPGPVAAQTRGVAPSAEKKYT
jgi:hypothetical protein